MQPALFDRLDHVVIGVRDLTGATDAYARMLGRSPAWRGRHPEYGTANTLFRLARGDLELLALDATEPTHPIAQALTAYLARRAEGVFALALHAPDLDRAVDALRAAGLTTSDAAPGRGVAGTQVRTWHAFTVARESMRGVNVLVIHRPEREGTGRDGPDVDPAAAVAVDHVVLFSDDLERALGLWRDTLGIPERWRREIPERGTVNVGLRLGGVTLELVAPLGATAGERGERLWGLAYAVESCDGAVARLRAGTVPVSDARPGLAPATRVATVKWPDRVPTLLIEHTARRRA